MKPTVSILIPTYNAGDRWSETLGSISVQTLPFFKKIIVDSGSSDKTIELAFASGFEVISIPQKEFNHGATRQLLIERAKGTDIALFLTQDAIFSTNVAAEELIRSFEEEAVALAYGRQLPHFGATTLESHVRSFNYPAESYIRSYEDRGAYHFKTIFCSNSFAAYRVAALAEVGGFPSDSIMGEDTIVAAKILMAGKKVAYQANAAVFHSHDYTFIQEFKRFFDTRVFHEQNLWLFQTYGRPTGEGIRFLKTELNYALKKEPALLGKIMISVLGKWLGYQAGKFYKHFPVKWLKKLSMHSFFWR